MQINLPCLSWMNTLSDGNTVIKQTTLPSLLWFVLLLNKFVLHWEEEMTDSSPPRTQSMWNLVWKYFIPVCLSFFWLPSRVLYLHLTCTKYSDSFQTMRKHSEISLKIDNRLKASWRLNSYPSCHDKGNQSSHFCWTGQLLHIEIRQALIQLHLEEEEQSFYLTSQIFTSERQSSVRIESSQCQMCHLTFTFNLFHCVLAIVADAPTRISWTVPQVQLRSVAVQLIEPDRAQSITPQHFHWCILGQSTFDALAHYIFICQAPSSVSNDTPFASMQDFNVAFTWVFSTLKNEPDVIC